MRVALGFKAHTGWAALIAIGGDLEVPTLIERSRVQLLPDGAFAPYHAAEELPAEEACESVKRDVAAAHDLAARAIRDAARRYADAGHEVCGCGVLVGP